jgi:hypothetical protein
MNLLPGRNVLLAIGIISTAPSLIASVVRPVPIQDRARGAERVVVAVVGDITATYERNVHGDELIVSHVALRVDEAIKGSLGNVVVALEGGTINGITLRVSDLPTLSPGERAVFFLTPAPRDEFTPHLRGQGILKLDSSDHVRNSSLTLGQIRQLARSAGR